MNMIVICTAQQSPTALKKVKGIRVCQVLRAAIIGDTANPSKGGSLIRTLKIEAYLSFEDAA